MCEQSYSLKVTYTINAFLSQTSIIKPFFVLVVFREQETQEETKCESVSVSSFWFGTNRIQKDLP